MVQGEVEVLAWSLGIWMVLWWGWEVCQNDEFSKLFKREKISILCTHLIVRKVHGNFYDVKRSKWSMKMECITLLRFQDVTFLLIQSVLDPK